MEVMIACLGVEIYCVCDLACLTLSSKRNRKYNERAGKNCEYLRDDVRRVD